MAATATTTPEAGVDGRLVVVSSDCHAGPEHMADFRPYVEGAHAEAFDDYAARVEAYEADVSHRTTTSVNRGKSVSTGGALVHAGHQGLWDATARAKDLDRDGISGEIIFPQGAVPFAPYPPLGAMGRMDYEATEELRNAGPRIYNHWLADLCAADPVRHGGVAVLPIRDLDAAVREVEWAREAGLHGGVSLPPLVDDEFPRYNDPVYEPLWSACEANGMVLNMHGGSQIPYGGGPERLALILSETDWFSHRGLWYLIFSGVFERHPRLHLAITEQRTHWAAPLLADLDSVYESPRCRPLREHLPRKPSDYFAENCFLGASFFSRLECDRRDDLGADRFMWGSDYPHIEGAWPFVGESLSWTFHDVEADELPGLLGEHACNCYGLDWEHLRGIAAGIGPTAQSILDAQPTIPDDPVTELSWAFRRHGAWH
jgi:predicted TIM-barrel fold metal-dependent hydrolase